MISTSVGRSYPRPALTPREVIAGGRLSTDTRFSVLSQVAAATAVERDRALETVYAAETRSHRDRTPGPIRQMLGRIANFLRPSRGHELAQARLEDTGPASRLPRRWAEFVLPQPEMTDMAMGAPNPDGGCKFSADDLALLSDSTAPTNLAAAPAPHIPGPRQEGQTGGAHDPMVELATYFDPDTMASIARAVAATYGEPAPLLDA